MLSTEHIVFLNNHGPEHIQKVIERAYCIITNMTENLSEFETFILLCAIQIHDIGNILGRAGHERNLHEIFNEHSKDIIIDNPEKYAYKIKDKLIECNEEINWIPDNVKHGRFGKWLENARDWNISRNRYWSTPIPIWECDKCHERKVLGSIAATIGVVLPSLIIIFIIC